MKSTQGVKDIPFIINISKFCINSHNLRSISREILRSELELDLRNLHYIT